MKTTIWAVTVVITVLSLANSLQDSNSTESPQREKELLAREFVAQAHRLTVARDNGN
jgi:hypothetical protein